MVDRDLRSYKGWLARPATYVNPGIHRLELQVKNEFCDLFEEYCREKKLAFEIEENPPFSNSTKFLVEYRQDDNYENFDEELQDIPFVFADYLKEKYGDVDPR